MTCTQGKFQQSLRLVGCGLWLGCLIAASARAQNAPRANFGQTAKGEGVLQGLVLDPSGARVAQASVHVSGSAGEAVLTTDRAGHFSVSIAAGSYTVEVQAAGFALFERDSVIVPSAQTASLNVELTIAPRAEVLDVPLEPDQSTSASANRSAFVFGDVELARLSDDDATLQKQLLAFAGVGGFGSPQIYVDGFSGGHFPPKNSIRQVRINENPYSAQYDAPGFGRVEVSTRPGTGSWHGSLSSQGYNAPFNAQNPYTGAEPPYYALHLDETLSGPLNHKTSFFASGLYNDQQYNSVVNAVDLTSLAGLSEAVPAPHTTEDGTLRLDRQVSANNTGSARYEMDREHQENVGVGLLVLPTEGYTTNTTTQTLQLSDTQILSPRIVGEGRFQYIRTRLNQVSPDNSPTLIVQGISYGGGSSAGNVTDNQDRFEFQEHLSLDEGKHFLRAGARYRLIRDANASTANFNGEFTFPDLASYAATRAASEFGATQFSLTTGQTAAKILTGDLGVYADDEWKATRSVTLNYGLRFESQTAIPDHSDWAPRLGAAWAIHHGAAKAPWLVLRGGFGLFYTRFDAANLLTSVRQNGVSQQTFVIKNPQFYATIPSDLGAATTPTPYRVSPSLRTQYDMVGGLTGEHQFGRHGTVSVNFLEDRGVHQYISRNINAPLPGTYEAGAPIRPLGGSGDLYQFSSDGTSSQTIFFTNASLNLKRWLSLYGFYVAQRIRTDTTSPASFPSNQYNLRQDYGPSSTTNPQQYYLGAFFDLPHRGNLTLTLNGNTAPPFNITTGQDNNGDSIYNDRPAFATDLTRASVVRTRFGAFDTAPIAGQTIIPINFGHSPSLLGLDMQAGKSFAVGPRRQAAPGAGAKPSGALDRPFQLKFSVEAQNLFNQVNPAQPIGVLSSPLFGRSLSLAPLYSSNQAANRTILLHGRFSF